jgi:pimeloyl-ACP methyl ester carboxylesterase
MHRFIGDERLSMGAGEIGRRWFVLAIILVAALSVRSAAAEPHSYRTEVAAPHGEPLALYAEETGEGPPILLLHGLGESTFTWRKIVPALSEAHRVIALDLKGFGRSDKPRDQAYSADDQAALVAAFMEKRELEGVTLVGHSFGGTVALRTALVPGVRVANRIRRLIIISAPALPESVASYLNLVEIPALPDALTATLPPELMARMLLNEARGGAGPIPDDDVKGYAAPYYDIAAKHAFLVTARSIVSETGDAVASRYRGISEPTLIVWCRKDPIVPLRAGQRLKRTLPNARIAVLERCHHLPQDERPTALVGLIRSFAGN